MEANNINGGRRIVRKERYSNLGREYRLEVYNQSSNEKSSLELAKVFNEEITDEKEVAGEQWRSSSSGAAAPLVGRSSLAVSTGAVVVAAGTRGGSHGLCALAAVEAAIGKRERTLERLVNLRQHGLSSQTSYVLASSATTGDVNYVAQCLPVHANFAAALDEGLVKGVFELLEGCGRGHDLRRVR